MEEEKTFYFKKKTMTFILKKPHQENSLPGQQIQWLSTLQKAMEDFFLKRTDNSVTTAVGPQKKLKQPWQMLKNVV